MATCTQAERLRKHSDRDELILTLLDEEAMCLENSLEMGLRTVRMQVSAVFKDQNGVKYGATRLLKMHLERIEE
jgi:hypothetical protein